MADDTSAYMVRGSWLKKVDEALNNTPQPRGTSATSLFYDVRPALLKSAWEANAAGLYCATACFIINDVADSSFVFPICAPTATSKPAGSANSSKFFVIWRGRWEVIGGDGGGETPELVTTTGTALTSLTTSQNSFLTSATMNALASAELSASASSSSGAIPYVESISCVDGELSVTIKYLSLSTTSASLSTTTGSALASASTTSDTFLTGAELQ